MIKYKYYIPNVNRLNSSEYIEYVANLPWLWTRGVDKSLETYPRDCTVISPVTINNFKLLETLSGTTAVLTRNSTYKR